MAIGNILHYFVIDMLGEFDSSLRTAGWVDPSALAGEGNKEGVFASVPVDPSSSVGKYPAIEIFIQGLSDFFS
jgi:hypothetical protein